MGKALVLALVAIGVGVLVYWLASPHTHAPGRTTAKPTEPPATSTSTRPGSTEPSGGRIADTVLPSGPVAPPRTPLQRESDATEARRAEFYERLHHDAGNAFVMVQPAEEDAATLDIKAAQDSPSDILPLLTLVFRNNAYYYGFRHVRFYAPNPPQMVVRYRLAAEANADEQGNWQTFQK